MAPAPSPSPSQPVVLHARYTAPHPPTSHTFSHTIALPASTASPQEEVKAKSAYLAELKGLVTKLQDEINVFLTERMEEDKRAAEAQGRKDSEREAKEEENYGEEVVEEDA